MSYNHATTQETRQLKDFDVLGAGACRRERLLADPSAKILLTHSALIPKNQRGLYKILFEETVQWLKPQQVLEVSESEILNKLSGVFFGNTTEAFLVQILLDDFQKEFPKTSSYLKSDLRGFVSSYLLEFPWQGPLLSAHFRYFPLYLKRRFQDPRLHLIAQKEWLWSYLSFADFGMPTQEQGRVFVNPSLQSLYSLMEVEEIAMSPGLSLIYYDYSQQKVRECKVDIWDAAVLDLLQEDRKYTLDQLIEQVLLMDLETRLSREEWRKKLFYLKSEGILL